MKVRDVMTPVPAYCTPEMNLGAAVEILWNRNCGILPVVDGENKVASVVTDRDICIALGTRNRLPGDITVAEVATQRAISCGADDDVRSALSTMAEAHVRRLPVVTADGTLEGLLSMDDIVDRTLMKGAAKGDGLTSEEVINNLKRVLAQPLPAKLNRAATA